MTAAMTAVVLYSAAVQANDDWLGRDKALHFGASAALASGGYLAGALASDSTWPRWAAGAGLALGAGVGKELWDLSGRGDPSWKDLAWDVAGTASGLAFAWAVERLIERLFARPAYTEFAPD